MSPEVITLIVAGFGLGLLHALDVDHVMAVSSLSIQKPGIKRTLLFSAHWACGHGFVLLLGGALLLGFGLLIPESLQYFAECAVGGILIVLGVIYFWKYKDLPSTRQPDVEENKTEIEAHKPIAVGLLHGLAGSAPALALIPAVNQGQIATGLTYLGIFSLGVMLSMVFFGLGFAWTQQLLQQHYATVFKWCRHLIATLSIVIGSMWLAQAM